MSECLDEDLFVCADRAPRLSFDFSTCLLLRRRLPSTCLFGRTRLTSSNPQIDLLQNSLHHLADLASEWAGHPENKSRAQEFEQMYLKHLRTLRENPSTYGALSLRSLLLLREECLRELGFYDLYDSIKADENSAALKALPAVLASVDAITDEGDRIETLIDQMNAGNMFDWGAVKILEMLRNGELDFASAKDRIKKRPKVRAPKAQRSATIKKLIAGST